MLRTLAINIILLLAEAGWIGQKKSDASSDAPSDAPAQIRALSNTVASQAKRIASLEKQMSKVGAGSCAAGQSASTGALSLSDADEPVELRAFREAERRRARKRQLERLSTIFNITVGSPLTALAIATGMSEKGVPRFVACADDSATLHIFEKNGSLLLSLPTELGPGIRITAIAIGTREDPILATAASDGQVRVYNVSLPKTIRAPKPKKGEPPPPPPPPTKFGLALDAVIPPPEELGSEGDPPVSVGALALFMRGRRFMLLVGDSSGSVRLMYRNGTQRQSVPVGGPVTAMQRNANQLAVAVRGGEVSLVDLGKMSASPLRCAQEESEEEPPDEADVVDLGFDVQVSSGQRGERLRGVGLLRR